MAVFLVKWIWVVFLIFAVTNAFSLRKRSRPLVDKNPELASGYTKLFWAYLFEQSTLWIIIGFGIIVGAVPTIFHFLRPRDGNVYVLVLYASAILMVLLKVIWVNFGGGAKFLSDYYAPTQKYAYIKSPLSFRLTSILSLIWVIIWIGMLWFYFDMPLPNLD